MQLLVVLRSHKGYRLPFASGDAATTFANSQTLVQVVSAVGMEYHIPVSIGGYTVTGDHLTEISGYANEQLTTIRYSSTILPQILPIQLLPQVIMFHATLTFTLTFISRLTKIMIFQLILRL